MIGGCAFEWGVLALKLYNRKLYDGFFSLEKHMGLTFKKKEVKT